MTTFSVWAPFASRVELVLDDARRALEPRGDGWFEVAAEAGADVDYAFAIDGSAPLPDPRSPRQPHGVHGRSRLVDHDSFDWSDDEWCGRAIADQIVYELHVGTFTTEGTFEAAISKLPYLVDLGVTAIEVMPVAAFPGERGWGYDGVDLYAPLEAYGGPDGLKSLVDGCHSHGLCAILDVVYNHLGPDGNYLGQFGPYFTDRYATPWGQAVNFDGADSDPVRRFFIDNGLYWLSEYHFDGLRLDAVHAILDSSALHILEELAVEVGALAASLGRELFLIAESDLNDPRVVSAREFGGYGIGAQWSDDFHHALHALLTGERSGYYADFGSVEQLAKALRDVFVYDGAYSGYRRRRHGRPVGDLPRTRFLGYLQDHDQIGNRARGERSSMVMSHDLLKVGAALVFTSPFVPMIFQGEEWGARTPFLYFTDHQDPELGRAVSEGRKREFAAFGWHPDEVPDPQARSTFERSKLDWSERDRGEHQEMLDWHKELIRLRRDRLRSDGRAVETETGTDGNWLIVRRDEVIVACNFSGTPVVAPLGAAEVGEVLLASPSEPKPTEVGFELAPESVAIWARAPHETRTSGGI